MSKKLELIGKKFNRLYVESFAGLHESKTMWKCTCDCGKSVIVKGSALTCGGTRSCGCYKIERTKECITKHRMSGTKEYYSWSDMKRRCLDPSNDHYEDYAGRGITVHQDFIDSFSKWFEEIGEKPDKVNKWTVGRIDNNDSYTYGNIRWELNETQARNHSKQNNNTSGITGVGYRAKGDYWYAQWIELNGTKKSKCFSCAKYPNAKELAIQFRENMVKELNSQGAGYAASHGSDK